MIAELIASIHPDYRLIAASAIALFITKRVEGWNISGCVAEVNFDTPIAVDDALNRVQALSDDRLVEIASELMRSGLVG